MTHPLTTSPSGHTRLLRRALGPLAAALAVTALLLLAFAPAASAKQIRLLEGTFGSAAQPTFGLAEVIAVDPATEDLLVIDAAANTLSRFNPDGTPHDFAALGTNVIDGAGGGNCAIVPTDCDQTPENGLVFDGVFTNLQFQIAVDDSGGSTDGNIYLNQLQADIVDVFAADGHYLGQLTGAGATSFSRPCGLAVDPAGAVYVSDAGTIFKFVPAGNPPTNADLAATFSAFPGSSQPCTLAAGAGPSSGALFAGVSGGALVKLDSSSGAQQYVVDPNPSASGLQMDVAANPLTGNVFAVKAFSVAEYDASGPSPILASTTDVETGSVASAGPNDKLYVTAEIRKATQIKIYSAPVPVPDVVTTPATITGLDAATLNGTVNPDGGALTDCHFEYLSDAAYQANPSNNRFAGAGTASCAESLASIGAGTDPVPVHADLAGLETDAALYHYRLLAASINGSAKGDERTFTTPGKPSITDTWATGVGFTEATLKAKINPNNAATTYQLEWGLDQSYGNPTSAQPVGSDDTAHTVSADLSGLDPGTTYHYHFLATNALGTTEGPDHTFHTFPEPSLNTACSNQAFRTGLAARLADCRAYELVSPLDKNGSDAFVYHFEGFNASQGDASGLEQSASAGGKLAYSSNAAFAGPLGAPAVSQYIATRTDAGWQTEAINPPMRGGEMVLPFEQYRAFSEDLSTAWLATATGLPLTEGPVEGFQNLYRRDNATGAFTWLQSSAVPEPQPCEDPDTVFCNTPALYHELQGVSADQTKAVFRVNDLLTPDAVPGLHTGNTGLAAHQLYHWAEGGGVRLVSVLPDGSPYPGVSSAGTPFEGISGADFSASKVSDATALKNAVSQDGTRVYWSPQNSSDGTDGPRPGRLYLRINADQPQSAIAAGQCTEPERACTLPVSELRTTAPAQFWAADSDGSHAIFSIKATDTTNPLAGNLYEYDLEQRKATLIATATEGVAATSEDLSRVYFASTNVLTGAQQNGEGDVAQAGESNLYLREGGSPTFIATLADGDRSRNLNRVPRQHSAHATPDGAQLAFLSTAALTGQENREQSSGEPAFQVFRYDADSGELICASCNPSGARPLAANVEGWTASWIPGQQRSLYARRALTDDGRRLFFNSFDALLPDDVNAAQDVYQWEAPGSGDCSESSPSYFASNGGCLSLVSSGQSSLQSEFAEASASGDDVFIRTNSSLDPSDPAAVDIYAARVGGGFPQPPPPPAPCEGEACRGPAGVPPPTAGAGTGEFVGKGNERPVPGNACGAISKQAQRKLAAARKAARKGQAKRARALGKQANNLKRRAKRCNRRIGK